MRLPTGRSAYLALALLGAALLVGPAAGAQPGTWRAYPAQREVTAATASSDLVWAATTGGLFSHDPATGEIRTYTRIEGLSGVGAQALAWDDARDVLWAAYAGGVLDRVDPATGTVRTFYDVQQAEQYPDRGIRRVDVSGDSLLLSTAFGLVVFDPVREEVRDTYPRFATLEAATPVSDALVAPLPDGRRGLWLATDGGVVYAPFDGSVNLRQPSAWTLDNGAGAPALSLAFFNGRVHVGTGEDVFVRHDDGLWGRTVFTDRPFSTLLAAGDRLVALNRFSLFVMAPGEPGTYVGVEDQLDWRAVVVGPGGALWGGDGARGLFQLPPFALTGGSINVEPATRVVPNGPFTNSATDLAVGPDGELWVSFRRTSDEVAGLSRLTPTEGGGTWTTVASDAADLPDADLVSAAIAPDGAVWAGSGGDGLARVGADGAVTTFRADNSTLRPATGTADFIVVEDALPEADGRMWVVNSFTTRPLHTRAPDGTWAALPFPAGIPPSLNVGRLYIDSFGQKWIVARSGTSPAGVGVAVVSTGTDPADPADDRGLLIAGQGEGGVGLPNTDVNAIVEDLSGRLWLGTTRGLATIFSPGSAFGGDPSLVQPQWARTPDGGDYFLRDLTINDMAVDPSDGKWLATSTGAYLINSEGNTIVQQFTPDNAPLAGDEVLAVAVDPASGRVYFATEGGLLSYDSEATGPSPTAEDLDVAPSPYRPALHARGVLISGLVAQTTVRVLTLDGAVVAAYDARGGSVRWDGLDQRTGEPVASGIYLVAAAGANGEGTAYGKIAVIR